MHGVLQKLGEPILSIPAAIKADSYFDPPGSGSFSGGKVCVGDPDVALKTAPHTIKNGRCAKKTSTCCVQLSARDV